MPMRTNKTLLGILGAIGLIIIGSAAYRFLYIPQREIQQNVPLQENRVADVATSTDENTSLPLSALKEFRSKEYGYMFSYPDFFVGGAQQLSPELRAAGVRESVVFETPRSEQERFAILVSVEDPEAADRGVADLADAYEEALRVNGLALKRTTSQTRAVSGVSVLERRYRSMSQDVAFNTVLFALRGSRLYIISLLRRTATPRVLEWEENILNSLQFF